MAAKASSAVSIPRFLLPQLTWRAPHLRPVTALAPSSPHKHSRQRREVHTTSRKFGQWQKIDWDALNTSGVQQESQSKLTQILFRALRASLHEPVASPASPLRPSGRSIPRHTFASASGFSSASGSVLQQSRAFHATSVQLRDHHFDTLKFVQRLKDEGFSEEQATAMMRVLSDVIEESIQNLTRTMVLREDAERATYTQKVDFTKLRSELLSSDNAEASLTRSSHERIANDLQKINSRLRDEIGRMQASVRLDLNLEKGRIREEANVQELKIKETEARIEQEVAGLRERVEGVKFSTLQWLMGVCTGTAAIILGAWRLLM